jgi:hypothetical protein
MELAQENFPCRCFKGQWHLPLVQIRTCLNGKCDLPFVQFNLFLVQATCPKDYGGVESTLDSDKILYYNIP